MQRMIKMVIDLSQREPSVVPFTFVAQTYLKRDRIVKRCEPKNVHGVVFASGHEDLCALRISDLID